MSKKTKKEVKLPIIGAGIELTQEEKDKIGVLRQQYHNTKLGFANAVLKALVEQEAHRQSIVAIEQAFDKLSGEILGGRGIDPKDPEKFGRWRFDVAAATMTRTS